MSPLRARWIILTPSTADAAWRVAITAAVQATGLTLILAHPSHPPEFLADPNFVVLTNTPSVAREAGADRVAVIAPDPTTSTAATAELFNLEPHPALWVASRVLAEAFSHFPGAVLFDDQAIRASGGSLRLWPDLAVSAPPPGDIPRSGGSGTAQSQAAQALTLYRSAPPGVGAVVEWHPAIFLYDSRRASGRSENTVDLTGRPRILVHGPYVALTPGVWRVTARFAVEEAAAKRRFRIDWGTQTEVGSEYFTLGQQGVYEVTSSYAFTEAQPAEFRIVLMEGALEGELTLLEARIEKVAEVDQQVPEKAA